MIKYKPVTEDLLTASTKGGRARKERKEKKNNVCVQAKVKMVNRHDGANSFSSLGKQH